MAKFVIVKQTCFNCKGPVQNNAAVCESCEHKGIDIYLAKLQKRNNM